MHTHSHMKDADKATGDLSELFYYREVVITTSNNLEKAEKSDLSMLACALYNDKIYKLKATSTKRHQNKR